MIKLENTEVLGWEHAIRGMRNPMNSWEKSDSGIGCSVDFVDRICAECDRSTPCVMEQKVVLGPNDHDLMMRLAKGGPVHAKYRRMIQLLPSSYNQKRTVMLNYEVLANIYPSRKNHKLDEWHTFCDWIEGLPYSEIIVGERSDDTGMTDEEKDKLFEEIDKILKTEYPKLDSDTLQVIHEKAEEILEEGKNIDWKKANPKLYPEDQRFEILDARSDIYATQ